MTALNILHANLQFEGGNRDRDRDSDSERGRDRDRYQGTRYTGTAQYGKNTQYGGNTGGITGNTGNTGNNGNTTRQGVQMIQSMTYGAGNNQMQTSYYQTK